MSARSAAPHQPPSNYLLRDLCEVGVPEAVSWMPVTLGWQLLGAMLVLLIGYFIQGACQRWWRNRYRREAIALIGTMQQLLTCKDALSAPLLQQLSYDLFVVLKAVLVYLQPQNSRSIGADFLRALDSHVDSAPWHSELGLVWQQSLLQPVQPLSQSELVALAAMSQRWLHQHSAVCIAEGKHVS